MEETPMNYRLDVIKEGVLLDQITLGSQTDESSTGLPVTLGRMQPPKVICPNFILAEHPSLSRLHAEISLEGNQLQIKDLKSTHGSFVNKVKLIPELSQKLNDGDVVRLGESTRMYIVVIEEDCSDEEEILSVEPIKAPQCQAPNKQKIEDLIKKQNEAKHARAQQIEKLQSGGGWGMDWDGDEQIREFQRKQDAECGVDGDESDDSQDGLNIEKLKMRSESLTDKQRGLLSKVEGLRRKVVKEATKKNKEKLEENNFVVHGKLKKQLEATEEKLKTSLKSTRENAKDSNDDDLSESDGEAIRLKDSDDDFDEFFDRTTKEKQVIPSSLSEAPVEQVLTYTSLKSTMNELLQERDRVTSLLKQQTQSHGSTNQSTEDDELEQFMQQNKESLRKEKLTDLTQRLTQITGKIESTSKLLSLAKPPPMLQARAVQAKQNIEKVQTVFTEKISVNKNSIAATIQELKQRQLLTEEAVIKQRNDQIASHTKLAKQEADAAAKKLPELADLEDQPEFANVNQIQENGSDSEEEKPMANIFKEIIKNSHQDQIKLSNYKNLMANYKTTSYTGKPQIEQLESEIRGNLEVKRNHPSGPVQAMHDARTMRNQGSEVEEDGQGEIDDWIAPNNQTGDGKTNLNAKFGY